LETITPTAQCSLQRKNFAIKIAGSRKESIRREKEDEADYKVYSDSSGQNDGIGAAAILYSRDVIL
jgi:hypothetical protein